MMMEEERAVDADCEEEETPAEETPTEIYDKPLGDLAGRTDPSKKGVHLCMYEYNEGKDRYQTYVKRFNADVCPFGGLMVTMTQKNGEYLGKQISFRKHWEFDECAREVISGRGEINFKWRTKFGGAVEITTTYFGTYNTGDNGSVMFPGRAKREGLMAETIDEELRRPILFDVRDGGAQAVVGFSRVEATNETLKEAMERGVWCGMARKGIVFDHGNTQWGYDKAFCLFCSQQDCVWEEAKSEMIAYGQSLPEDTPSNGRRRMLYRQMAIRTSGGGVLGKGNRVALPECVISGVRELFPSGDGEYMGHRDA
jgi:hypothetical protein